MKPYQSFLIILVILQVGAVVLLGIMTFQGHRSLMEIEELRDDLEDMEEALAERSDDSLPNRVSALEASAGMRDPDADRAAAALRAQMAEANALRERYQKSLGGGAAAAPAPAMGDIPPPPQPEVEEPAMAGLSPTEQAIAKLPIVAEILSFDADWQFYTVNKGQLDGLRADQEFAVRQVDSYELLANVKVSRLHPQDAIVELVRGTTKEGAPTPSVGDVLIDISQLQ